MKKNLLVTLANQDFLPMAKQVLSSAYYNARWQGDYMLLAHEIPDEDLAWFRDKGILVKDNVVFDLCSESAVRFNESVKIGGVSGMAKGMEWKNNYFNVDVTDADFPWDLAAKAGLEEEYKERLIPVNVERDKVPSNKRH